MFAKKDPAGRHVITGPDFVATLKSLGYDYLTPDKLQAIVRLFETDHKGQGYGSQRFVDYVPLWSLACRSLAPAPTSQPSP